MGIRNRRSSYLLISSISALAMAHAAQAQDAQAAASQPAAQSSSVATQDQGKEIIVTGTRVRSGFQAPTPTQVIGVEDIKERGATNITNLISELPAFGNKTTASATGNRNPVPGQNFADLRGLGTARTLVLVDGHRFPPTVPVSNAQNPYQIDLNLIPTLMIDRVDVVTGGASAQYGSDAVSGVVNLILKKKVDGLQGEVQSGISDYGDASERRIGLVGGKSFAQDRGHIVLAGDYVKAGNIPGNSARPWAQQAYTQFTDPTSTLANGKPRTVIGPNSQLGNRTPGGLITSVVGTDLTAAQRTALVGQNFTSATTVSPFVLGLYNTGTVTNNNTTGTTSGSYSAVQQGGAYPLHDNGTLLPSLERAVFFGRADYDLTDSVKLIVSGSYGKSKGIQQGVFSSDQTGLYNPATGVGSQVKIYSDNPFIPTSLRANLPAQATNVNGAPPSDYFTVARANYDWGSFRNIVTDTAYQGTIGAEGKFGSRWSWDGDYSYGDNVYLRVAELQRDRSLYALATDVVRAPTGNAAGIAPGTIVCRAQISPDAATRAAASGCVPTNIFGEGSVTPAALNYFTSTARLRSEYSQHAAQFNLRGSPFDTWAGPVAIAAGLEYRYEKVAATVDQKTAANLFDNQGGLPYRGRFNVKEGYFEATVPLAKDLPFARSLALNGAVRHAIYGGDANASGGVTTWKVGGTYSPIQGLLLRAAHSLDIRSPSLYELDQPATIIFNTISFNGRSFSNVLVGVSGNRNLTPERAKTTTIGGSFQPAFIPGLQFSADYYHIDIAGAISSLGGTNIAANCQAGLTQYCSKLSFSTPGDPTSNLVAINDQFINLSSFNTAGVDFTVAYRRRVGPGTLSLHGSATYVSYLTVITPGIGGGAPTTQEFSGGVGIGSSAQFFVPHWKGQLTTTYALGRFSLTGQVRYVGTGRFNTLLLENATPTSQPDISAADNRVKAYAVVNLSGTIDVVPDRAQFFWVVNNVLNTAPRVDVNLNLTTQTNGGLYDVIGRYYRIGLRFKI